MKNTIIPLGSYTAARKASGYLGSHGIRARVVKTGHSRGGCMFGISVMNGDAGHICRMLGEIGIRCENSMPVPPPPPPPPFPPRPPRPPHRR